MNKINIQHSPPPWLHGMHKDSLTALPFMSDGSMANSTNAFYIKHTSHIGQCLRITVT